MFCVRLSAGGNWDNSSSCGSRSRNANNGRSIVNPNYGGRGVIRYLTVMAESVTLSKSVHGEAKYKAKAQKPLLVNEILKARAFYFGSKM